MNLNSIDSDFGELLNHSQIHEYYANNSKKVII